MIYLQAPCDETNEYIIFRGAGNKNIWVTAIDYDGQFWVWGDPDSEDARVSYSIRSGHCLNLFLLAFLWKNHFICISTSSHATVCFLIGRLKQNVTLDTCFWFFSGRRKAVDFHNRNVTKAVPWLHVTRPTSTSSSEGLTSKTCESVNHLYWDGGGIRLGLSQWESTWNVSVVKPLFKIHFLYIHFPKQ